MANLDHVNRVFGRHRDADAKPDAPETQIGGGRSDEKLEAELADLEDDFDGVDG